MFPPSTPRERLPSRGVEALRRSLVASLAMPFVGVSMLGLTALSGEACLTDACKDSYATYGRAPGQGSLVDPNTWQSTPIEGEWVAFPHQARVEFFHSLGRRPYEVLVWVSAEKTPLAASNFTLAGGDTATVFKVLPDVVSLTNGTCADYYVRVLLRAAPAPPDDVRDASTSEAGDGDGGTSEGGASDARSE